MFLSDVALESYTLQFHQTGSVKWFSNYVPLKMCLLTWKLLSLQSSFKMMEEKKFWKNIKLHTVPVNVNVSVHAVVPNYHVKILHP